MEEHLIENFLALCLMAIDGLNSDGAAELETEVIVGIPQAASSEHSHLSEFRRQR